jgi:hypothetical protein
MKNKIAIIVITSIMIVSCAEQKHGQRSLDKKRASVGLLSSSDFALLKQFLNSATSAGITDTIIIKYDYNNETCWNALDQKDNDYILQVLKNSNEYIQSTTANRPALSFFQFREPGTQINKLINWNQSILIDKDLQLFNLLFKNRSTCGNSAIILPDGRFILYRSDSHFEVLQATDRDIAALLQK